MKEELWVGNTPSGWSSVIWIPMKGILRAVKPRGKGLIKDIKLYEARTPYPETGIKKINNRVLHSYELEET